MSVKDLNYVMRGGTHVHLLDVVDKREHGRKCKTHSPALSIKHLERWVFKVAQTAQRPFKTIDAHYTSPPLSQQANLKSVDVNFDFNK
ncbi:hypothetical protein AnigIFM63604_002495 [Aspergillus niger]|uniref:Uncharacterized protein n=1 Tax=Aspergillus niger TaxID=5061 RepID=A0A9W5ZZ31_ASPNG|nr:hypothetical protein AnigIFM63604_002495 [Aspergillus niger]